MSRPPRVRIAPSPTGDPHVGTAYIALYNYAYARRHGGSFVLRIEDTDQARSTEGSEEAIFEALRWLGLNWDEGPDCGGDYGPYRQSERLPSYQAAVEQLLQDGNAYRCFCTSERLAELRKRQREEKVGREGYDGLCRDLGSEEVARRVAEGEPAVVRFKMRGEGATECTDQLRGTITFENAREQDFVIMKSDGFPTYHLANVVDDHAMEITDVIRGDEWVSSLPKHIALYAAFGWEPPRFYHLDLLLNPDGKGKLSKRKNPVSVFHFRDLGYLPGSFLNFLGTLGHSIADDRDRFTLQEMVEKFDWARVSVSGGSRFDTVKLDAFNADDIRALSPEDLTARINEHVLAPERIAGLVAQAQPRITRLDDFIPYVSFFFGGSVNYEDVEKAFRVKNKRTRKEVLGILTEYLEAIEKDPRARGFTAEGLEAFSREFCTSHEWKTGELFGLLRVAVTGRKAAPSLFDTISLCGKDRVRMRVREAMAYIKGMDAW